MKTHDVTYRNMTPNSVQGWNTSYGFLPFQRVINAFAGDPQVTSGKMMGSVGLKVNGRIFAMLVKGKFVAKLPKDAVDELVQSGTGEYFEPGHGRLMKQWVALRDQEALWVDLARKAREYVQASAHVKVRG